MTQIKERNSSFELIRIVAMSLIIIHHFLYHGITAEEIGSVNYNLINPYFYTGVNIFFLISGWFLIRFSFRKLFSFILLVLSYCLFNYALCIIWSVPVDSQEILFCFLWPVSNSPYWFLQAYLFIMLLAPIVNKGLQSLSLNQLRVCILLLTIGTVYSCDLGGNMSNKAHSFLQGLYLYCVGYYLHCDRKLYEMLKPLWCFIGYFVLLAIGSILNIKSVYFPCNQYNSFSLVGSSVLLVVALSKLNFRSSFINLIGGASLGCYMLQDGTFGNNIIYPFLRELWAYRDNYFTIIWEFALIFVGLWIAAFILNPVFKSIASKGAKVLSNIKIIRKLSYRMED